MIINGKPGSGKDIFVKFCREYGKTRDLNVYNYHASYPAKKALETLGYSDYYKTNPKVRDLLAHIKSISDEVWDSSFHHITDFIKICGHDSSIIFIHEREPKNITKLLENFDDITTLFIDRKVDMTGISNDIDLKTSKDSFPYDLIIHNHLDLRYLKNFAIDFIENLYKEGENNVR